MTNQFWKVKLLMKIWTSYQETLDIMCYHNLIDGIRALDKHVFMIHMCAYNIHTSWYEYLSKCK